MQAAKQASGLDEENKDQDQDQASKDKKDGGQERLSYLSNLFAVIEENMRIKITNLHIRYEDTKVSRRDHAFNFGVMVESIQYSMTNNQFQRTFLNIEDKKQEQKSFSALELKQIAVYWNSNAQENWTQNKEFINLSPQKTLEFSKKHMDNLRRKHYLQQQNHNQSQVFLIQPCNMMIKFRINLAPNMRIDIPKSTTAIEFTSIGLCIDEEIYKDAQYLSKFFAWHSASRQKARYLKYRPPINTPVKGNARAFWQYAINATRYLIKKAQQSESQEFLQKRQAQLKELVQLYVLKQVNKYFKQSGLPKRMLKSEPHQDPQVSFETEEEFKQRLKQLQYKMTPEQLVVAFTKAEPEANRIIEQKQEESTWRAWVPSMLKSDYWYGGNNNLDKTKQDQIDNETSNEIEMKLNEIIEKHQHIKKDADETQSITSFQGDQGVHSQLPRTKIQSHLTVSIPQFEIQVTNKQQSAYNQRCFMSVLVQDIFFQKLAFQNQRSTMFFSIKNFEIIDKFINSQKFSRMIFKQQRQSNFNLNATQSSGLSNSASRRALMQRYAAMGANDTSLAEVEEETNPNVNNGLPQIQEFEQIHNSTEQLDQYFLIAQADEKVDKNGNTSDYKLDLFMNTVQLFYNRVLISRMETFVNQARIVKVWNASAQEDFDKKVQEYEQSTRQQVNKMLDESQFNVHCNLKGIEILVPDEINFETSRFVLIQSNNLMLRSGNSSSYESFSRRSQLVSYLRNQFRDSNLGDVKTEIDFDHQKDQQNDSSNDGQFEDYSFVIYDIQVFYVPSNQHLDAIQFNEISKDDIERKFTVLHKTDIICDICKGQRQEKLDVSTSKQKQLVQYIKLQVSIPSLDVRMTNRELKELKYFADNVQKYHNEISLQVYNELRQLKYYIASQEKYQNQTDYFANETLPVLPIDSLQSTSRVDDQSQQAQDLLLSGRKEGQGLYDIITRLNSQRSKGNLQASDENMAQKSNNESSDDDEFFDAQDYFDSNILDMLNLDKNLQIKPEIEEQILRDEAKELLEKKTKRMNVHTVAMLNLEKLHVVINEDADFRGELVKGLKERLGGAFQHDQLEFNIKQKGIQFLNFEMSKIGVAMYSRPQIQLHCLVLKEFCLLNNERITHPQVVLKSCNFDVEPYINRRESFDQNLTLSNAAPLQHNSYKRQQHIFDPEEEDNIMEAAQINTKQPSEEIRDYFISVSNSMTAENQTKEKEDLQVEQIEESKENKSQQVVDIQVGLAEFELTEPLIKKFYDLIVTDFPKQSPNRMKQSSSGPSNQQQASQLASKQKMQKSLIVKFDWDGLISKVRVRKEITQAKLLGLKLLFEKHKQADVNSTTKIEAHINDFQVLQQENELIFRHNFLKDIYQEEFELVDQQIDDILEQADQKPMNLLDFQVNITENKNDNQRNVIDGQAKLTNLLIIIDTQSILQAATNVLQVVKSVNFKTGQSSSSNLNSNNNAQGSSSLSQQESSLKRVSSFTSFGNNVQNQAIGSEQQQQQTTSQNQHLNEFIDEFESHKEINFKFSVNGSHLQLPQRESKNSFFVGIDQFDTSFTQKKNKSQELLLNAVQIDCFVAKQIDQQNKYYLLKILNTNLNQQNGTKLVRCSIDSIQVTFNENYVLLLAAIIDQHFEDTKSIIELLQSQQNQQQQSQQSQQMSEGQKTETDRENSEFVDFEDLKDESELNNFMLNNKQVISYINFQINTIEVAWVFDMGFDDHQENFVTLHNRNQAKKIMDIFDQQEQVSSSAFDHLMVESSFQPRSINSSGQRPTTTQQPRGNTFSINNSKQKYDKFCFQLSNFEMEKAILKGQNDEDVTYTACKFDQLSVDHIQKKRKQHCVVIRHDLEQPDSNNQATSLDRMSSSAFRFVQAGKEYQKEQPAKIELDLTELRVCQSNAKVISQLAKNAYSCKNLLQRGNKRRFFKLLMNQQQDVIKVNEVHEFELQLNKIRIIMFDSDQLDAQKSSSIIDNRQNEKFVSPGSIYANKLENRTGLDFDDQEQQHQQQFVFRRNGLLVVEASCDVILNNTKQSQEQQVDKQIQDKVSQSQIAIQNGDNESEQASSAAESNQMQPDSKFIIKVTQLTSYFNQNQSTLSNLSGPKIILIHPTCVYAEQQYFSQKKVIMTVVNMETIEIELSFRQVFLIKLMIDKVFAALQPLMQIINHLKEKEEKRLRRNNSNSQQVDRQGNEQQMNGVLLSVTTAGIYFALIREHDSGRSLFLSSEHQCIPMMSLEIKWVDLNQKKQVTGNVQTDVTMPIELYYFNQQLNFFEPMIEKVVVRAQTTSDLQGMIQSQKLLIDDVLNINFTTALYENLFVLIRNFNDEQNNYQQESKQSNNNAANQSSSFKPNTNNSVGFDQMMSVNQFFIKNKTGEILLFKGNGQPVYNEVQPNETMPLEFTRENHEEDDQEMDDIAPAASSENHNIVDSDFTPNESSDHDEEYQSNSDATYPKHNANVQRNKPKSKYRRENYKFRKSEPNRVHMQLVIQYGKQYEKTQSFEVNFDSLICQRVFLDEQRKLYVICQTQSKNGSKFLIVRSPMQITNNLQIPIEISLIQPVYMQQAASKAQQEMTFDDEINTFDNKSNDASNNGSTTRNLLRQTMIDLSLVVKPESSLYIPLKACAFDHVQIRPLQKNSKSNSNNQSSQQNMQEQHQFEWSKKTAISLMQDEKDIFEHKPIVLQSKMLRGNRIVDRNNNQVFFVLNSNIYSIRSVIDFNTQQTEFISLRYLSITAPVVFQNLIPAPVTVLFKDIIRDQQSKVDKQLYDLELKLNSSLQLLYLNPLGNFDFSLCIPGFQQSSYVSFKDQKDDDYQVSEEIHQANLYVESLQIDMPRNNQDENEQEQQELQTQQLKQNLYKKCQYRFLKQKKMLIQLTSKFQNQFNICCNVAFVQGYYHVCFYSKYWLLNNTQMPLQATINTQTFSYDTLELPYESNDFDFSTIKQFTKEDQKDQKANEKAKGKQKQIEETKGDGSQQQMMHTSRHERVKSTISFDTETYTALDTRRGLHKYNMMDDNISQMDGGNDAQLNFVRMKKHMMANNPFSQLRLKPWEVYKTGHTESEGLIAALSQEDINRVSSVYFTQELLKEDRENDSVKEVINTTRTGGKQHSQQDGKSSDKKQSAAQREHLVQLNNQYERMTKFSKTSIQIQNYNQQIQEQQAMPLNHTSLSKFELYDAPLKDKDQLKRVILFSDIPTDVDQTTLGDEYLQQLQLKVCDSEWTNIPFDMTKLQSSPIVIKDSYSENPKVTGKQQQRSMFELVASVQFLPYPFSFSKLIQFQPRFIMVNKTFETVQIVQAQCEELGTFKIFPQETSVFHWTNAEKPQEINVKLNDTEFSGNFKIDLIGDINLRLKSIHNQDNTILNVSITEEKNSYYILFSDVSYAPPYRLENLTRTRFKVSQVNSRTNDYDVLDPFQSICFAWSYPLHQKLLKIALVGHNLDDELGSFSLDSINKSERMILKDRKGKRDFVLELLNEGTLKVCRIVYPENLTHDDEETKTIDVDTSKNAFDNGIKISKTKLRIMRLGLSLVNSHAREICYTSISNLRFTHEATTKHKKVSLKAQDIQIDNQLVRQNDAIILSRQQGQKMDFISVKFHQIHNEAIENLVYYKYFILCIVPFELKLDGNFCDETYKYMVDVIQMANKHARTTSNIKQSSNAFESLDEIEQIKGAIKQFQKPVQLEQHKQNKFYFEQFYIDEINLKFKFTSSPVMFREFTMNATLKFLMVMLSSMKNVNLRFSKYQLTNTHILSLVFWAQMKRHYLQQIYSHKQLLKLVSSMGLFGTISGTISDLTKALKTFVIRPLHEDNKVQAMISGSVYLIKDTIVALTNSVGDIICQVRDGFAYLIAAAEGQQSIGLVMDKKLFDDDIEQAQQNFSGLSTPFSQQDTQNRIWLKILEKDEQTQEVKKRKLRKQKELQQQEDNYGQNQLVVSQQENYVQASQEMFRRQTKQHKRGGGVYEMTAAFTGAVLYIPKTILISGSQAVSSMFTNDTKKIPSLQKVRPPRFVSFTMELEPYSKKKAYALERLNDINLKVFETETIQKLYSMSSHVLIITGKRIICVDEHKDPNSNRIEYTHWNVFFNDILRMHIDIYDKEANQVITQQQFAQLLNSASNQAKIMFILKVYHHAAPKSNDSNQHDQFDTPLAGLQVSHTDIKARIKDFGVIKKIYKTIEMKMRQCNY